MKRFALLAFGAFLTCSACSVIKPVAVAPDFEQKALREHRVIAVLPFYVEYPEQGPEAGVSLEQHLRQRRLDRIDDSYALQADLAYALTKKARRLSFRVQDTTETNRLLRQSGLSWDSLYIQPREALAKLVHADAVLTPYVGLNKQGGGAGFIWALGLTTGVWVQNQQVATGFIFHDGATGAESCRCQCNMPGSVFDDPGALADRCMKFLIRGLPYRAKTLQKLKVANTAPAAAPRAAAN
jgi:hypothetical protein